MKKIIILLLALLMSACSAVKPAETLSSMQPEPAETSVADTHSLRRLDNRITVTETDMTVQRPQKNEHGDAAEIPGQAYKNDIGRTMQHPYK